MVGSFPFGIRAKKKKKKELAFRFVLSGLVSGSSESCTPAMTTCVM